MAAHPNDRDKASVPWVTKLGHESLILIISFCDLIFLLLAPPSLEQPTNNCSDLLSSPPFTTTNLPYHREAHED